MKMINTRSIVYSFLLVCSLWVIPGHYCMAQGEGDGIFDKVQWQRGPSIAEIDKWAQIQIPAGYLFANGSDTRLIMEAMGNPPSNSEVGFFAPETLEWFVVFEFDKVGYIKDDEKGDLDADAILNSIRKGTQESNKIREEKGYTTLSIVGWEVQPTYNETTHNLEWAIRAQDGDGGVILNHNTRLLGRRGVMRVTLVVDPMKMADVLPVYREYLSRFSFKSGQDYASFIKGDKIAGYGLTALVAGGAGVAAAKFGLFKILAKFGKLIFVAVIAFLGTFWNKLKNLFSRNTAQSRTIPEEKKRDDPRQIK